MPGIIWRFVVEYVSVEGSNFKIAKYLFISDSAKFIVLILSLLVVIILSVIVVFCCNYFFQVFLDITHVWYLKSDRLWI